ncbi:MAG: lipopolysaccharide heptosyltransferase I [Pseudomonadota bacterium]|jgi:heptosyltransferase-1
MHILLIKTSSLGDVVHNLPVASDIRTRFPEARIDWVVEEAFVGIARLHPAVDRVIPVALRRWRQALLAGQTRGEMGAFRRALQARAYDLVLDTQGLLKSALIARLARGRRCGYCAEAAREPLAARFYDACFAIPRNLHAVERNRWLAAAALDYAPDLPLDYGVRAQALQAGWLPPAPYAVLLSATSRADKLWPEGDWLALGAALAARGLTCVLPAGSPPERQRAARLATDIPGAVAAPPLDIPGLAGLLAGAAAVIGVDTGLTHLAVALGRPTVALFCASDPELTGVYGGAQARNLGRHGQPPRPEEVMDVLAGWGL